MERAHLTVTRRAKEDVRQRQLIVSLDGAPFATLLFGEEASREIEPGEHSLRVNNTLVWKTVDFEARPGERVTFSAVNRAGWGTYSMLSLLGVGPLYVRIDREA
jgi:hypothetical protein